MATVENIQSEIASIIDGDNVLANINSTDYSLRLTYMNMALREWQEAYDWQSLYKEYNTLSSQASGNASVVLPQDFRKLASYPVIANDVLSSGLYPETRPQEAGRYSSTQQRVEILGNYRDNYVMRIYGTNLISGASIKIPYYASAGSLVSGSVVPIPNPDYLTKRTLAYIFEANEDARFPQAKLDAERILGSLIDYENVFSEASDSDRVKSVDERHGFRMGE